MNLFSNAYRRRKFSFHAWNVVGFLVFGLLCGTGTRAATSQDRFFPAPVYVTLQGSDAVEILPSGRVCTGLVGAHYDAVSPDGRLLLVSSAKRPEVYLVDTRSCKRLATFDVGPTAQGVAFSPDGHRGLAVSARNGSVSVIDVRSRKVIKTIAVGTGPHNAVFTADGKRAYVTLQGGAGFVEIDMQTLAKVREIPTIDLPHNLDFSPDGKTLWIRDFVGHVAAVNAATGKLFAEIPVGPSHAGIDVIPDGRKVLTGAIGGHLVDVVDPEAFKVIQRIDVGRGPHGVRASRNGRWAYVAVTGTNELVVLDMHTLKVARRIPLHGKFPFWIAVAGKD